MSTRIDVNKMILTLQAIRDRLEFLLLLARTCSDRVDGEDCWSDIGRVASRGEVVFNINEEGSRGSKLDYGDVLWLAT